MATSISPCYEFEAGTTVLSTKLMKMNIEFGSTFVEPKFNIRVISFLAPKTPFQPNEWVPSGN